MQKCLMMSLVANSHLCLTPIHWAHSAGSGEPRGIPASIRWGLASLMKFCVQWHIVCDCDTGILTCFQTCFCIYLSSKHFPKIRLLWREVLWFPCSEEAYASAVPLLWRILFSSSAHFPWRPPASAISQNPLQLPFSDCYVHTMPALRTSLFWQIYPSREHMALATSIWRNLNHFATDDSHFAWYVYISHIFLDK